MSQNPHGDSATADLVQIRREGGVAIVIMNNPERRNAFSAPMRRALLATFDELMQRDDDCRAIVLTGAGGHFCAGGDLSEMTSVLPSLVAMRERIALGANVFRAIYTGPKPVVAAVEGNCIGAGMSLAAACDIVVGALSSKLACAFVKVGLMPDTGLLWTLPRKVGGAKARELMLSGAAFDGLEAARIGLFDDTAAGGDVLAAAIERARQLSQFPPVTMALLKASLVNGGNSIEDACRLETDLNPLTRQTHDHAEAVAAFMEKRNPVFTGN
ncbi:enoyl-CoA hydratase [Herbaspirillum rubrisubalbicans]|jgi:enoyl-CoA hydratase/carnithine racemase|uniref:Enoyl-CoA hydratase n=1 Tax=Herbaspirillum rubrisubalbicans TaxID=80842 RepID=A0ABX9C7R6_9BURK|nr:enoyl-CoA hydratase/isomerase family protein [Herbaspirillum rubrisubalbicans]MCP1572921.1 enoyl-CoA hydratase/carnithine racemase [Herbaspirillum rubrisubalbicans]NQE47255.1 enoyl-CoA hydratase [Herbaspirillum rubrisubalbicans]RAM66792.1 enoyl-CoA hydratase [Herbaspirillum rubrisubalbicans]RAN47451.1 enoyl-CoA hydratase [Herbaspirillum rubrisubalbicans]